MSIDREDEEIGTHSVLKGLYEKITFKRCIFRADVIFYDIEVFGTVSLIECTFEGNSKVHFQSGIFHQLVSMSFKRLNKLYIESGDFDLLYVGYWGNETSIKEIYFENLRKCQGEIYVYKSKVEKIFLQGDNLSTRVKVGNSKINSLIINNLTAHTPLKLVNIGALNISDRKSECNFHFSNLGESEFYDVDFDSFDDFNMQNSLVGNSIFVNCLIEKQIKAESGEYLSDDVKSMESYIRSIEEHLDTYVKNNIVGVDIEGMQTRLAELRSEYPVVLAKSNKKKDRYKRENYKQMKIGFQKIGDSINEKRFHALEMNEFLSGDMHWSDKLILRLSKLSSNFGQSLIRPFLFHILVVHLALFIVFFAVSSDYYFSFRSHSWPATWSGFKDFVFLISPFRDLTIVNPGILDLLFRANAGFFLYNFLRASRKFYH